MKKELPKCDICRQERKLPFGKSAIFTTCNDCLDAIMKKLANDNLKSNNEIHPQGPRRIEEKQQTIVHEEWPDDDSPF